MSSKVKRVAIVQRILSHYREPIFRMLCLQSGNIEYTFFSESINLYDSVKPIDPKKAEIPVENGGLRWRFLKNRFIGNFFWQSGVIKLSVSKEFDTIIYEGSVYYISTWIAAVLARLTGKRILMWGHGYLKDERGPKDWIRRAHYHLFDGILLYHNRSRDILIKKGFKPENIYVVYNSLDYSAQLKIRNEITEQDKLLIRQGLFKNPQLPILIFIGRLIARKKLSMILGAVNLLKNKGIICNMLFIGGGTESEQLKSKAQQMGLADNFCLYGECYNEKNIGILISASDICVSPGEIGLTCMHSFVYGTPVITHDDPDTQGPEYEAIIAGYNGGFFKKDSVESLAAEIERWLLKNQDSNTIAAQCYEVIDKFYNPMYQVKVINDAVQGKSNCCKTSCVINF